MEMHDVSKCVAIQFTCVGFAVLIQVCFAGPGGQVLHLMLLL